MIERFELNKKEWPTIAAPHDCVIEHIEVVNDEFLVFHFEQNINYHDSIKHRHPNANSLIMRFHLLDRDFDIYRWKKIFNKYAYIRQDHRSVLKLWNEHKNFNLEYLYNHVAYNSMIIELSDTNLAMIKIEADYVEFEWIIAR